MVQLNCSEEKILKKLHSIAKKKRRNFNLKRLIYYRYQLTLIFNVKYISESELVESYTNPK